MLQVMAVYRNNTIDTISVRPLEGTSNNTDPSKTLTSGPANPSAMNASATTDVTGRSSLI